MSTRSTIWIKREDGLEGVYCHFDGYLSNNGEILYKQYSDVKTLETLIANGEMSSLGDTVDNTEFYDEGNSNYKVKTIKDTEKYAEEYNYIFIDGGWFYYEDDSGDLKRLEPSLI